MEFVFPFAHVFRLGQYPKFGSHLLS